MPGMAGHGCLVALSLLALSRGAAPDACGSSEPPAESTEVVSDGRASLGKSLLCSSYACRKSLLAPPQTLPGGMALTQHLLACALPSAPGEYDLLDFVVSGLAESTADEWWSWVQQSLVDLGGHQDSIARATWFPMGGNVQFYVSTGTGVNASGMLTTSSLGEVLNELAHPVWQSSIVTPAPQEAASSVKVLTLRLSPVSVSAPPGEQARANLLWYRLLAVALVVYASLALLAYRFGPRWLPPLVLCWPEVCDGRGCIFYRITCVPFVLVYNALRIYCWTCCMSYLTWLGHTRLCKCCCWHEFTDPDFPPDERSIGKVEGDAASGVMNKGGADWAKASAIAGQGGQAHLFDGRIEPADVLQGALGDCWLMAASACVAERPDVLEQVILSKHVDPRGKYHFRLWNQVKSSPGTKWVDIFIDENIPVHPGTLTPKFARSHCNEMWVLLLEKAFAKMYGGYDRLDGGQMHWALTAMTGNPPVSLMKSKPGAKWTSGKESLDDDQLFLLLRKLRRNGAFICCAMIAQSNKMGLIDGHAYSIIQLQTVRRTPYETSFFRLVQIRNPHGQTEWQGAWSDKSKTWDQYPYVRNQLCGTADRTEDGTFWMQWEDFAQFWKEVQIVDCGVNIRTVASPNYNETWCGPVLSCLLGCWEYWCCCLGLRRLYLGREPCSTLQTMEEGMDAQVGWDQEGCFCNTFDKHAASSEAYGDGAHSPHSADDDQHHEADERAPLCPWTATCGGHPAAGAGAMRTSGRTLSRAEH